MTEYIHFYHPALETNQVNITNFTKDAQSSRYCPPGKETKPILRLGGGNKEI